MRGVTRPEGDELHERVQCALTHDALEAVQPVAIVRAELRAGGRLSVAPGLRVHHRWVQRFRMEFYLRVQLVRTPGLVSATLRHEKNWLVWPLGEISISAPSSVQPKAGLWAQLRHT